MLPYGGICLVFSGVLPCSYVKFPAFFIYPLDKIFVFVYNCIQSHNDTYIHIFRQQP